MTNKYSSARAQRPRRRSLQVVAIVAVVILIALGGYWLAHRTAVPEQGRFFGRHGGRSGGFAGMTMPVGTATAKTGDIGIDLDALGTVTPLRDVTVSAQVSGQLLRVLFKEGQMVKQGDLLAEIDPRSYQAALTQAQGALARDQALLAEARIDLARYQTLYKQDSIAKQELDSQASLVHQYEGTLKADQGQIGVASVNLAYTRIVAPVTGRVGLRQIDPGNNVQSGTGIVVITQLKPIDVLFTIAEDNLPDLLKHMSDGSLKVDALSRDKTEELASGSLAAVDNLIDTSTGTVKAKAEFANADEILFPNQFVNVRVHLTTLAGATIVPSAALQRGANGMFVFLVNANHTVTQRTVKTGPSAGQNIAVTEGLKPGDVVVTDGADNLRDGSRVELPGEAPPPTKAKQQKGRWRGKRQ